MPGWLWPPRSRPCPCGLARRRRAAVAPNGGVDPALCNIRLHPLRKMLLQRCMLAPLAQQ
eukprot:3531554-Pleurochrysis_carterae.AAC.1